MAEVMVLDPYSGVLHLTYEQREKFVQMGQIAFAELPKEYPVLDANALPYTMQVQVCRFKTRYAGKQVLAEVIAGNPNNIREWHIWEGANAI